MEDVRAPEEYRRIVEVEAWRDRLARPPRGLDEALAAVKPSLDLVRVRTDVDPERIPPGAVVGHWHVRDSDAVPLTAFYPISAEGGGYREPDSGILTELGEMDMRRPEVRRATFERRERQREKRRRAQALKTEQLNDDMAADLRAGWRVKGRIVNDEGKPIKRKVA